MKPKGTNGTPYVFAAPLLPDKEEPWRRFLQDVAELRAAEYERLRGHLGVRRELVWLVPSLRGYVTVVYLEVDGDLDEFVRLLAASEEAFDLWFKERIAECHGCVESAKSLQGSSLDPIFFWDVGSERP